MTPGSKAKRVRIYVSEGDTVGTKPAHLAIIELLVKENANGATVFRATEGFGGSGTLYSISILEITPAHQPLVVEWVDTPERVGRLLERIQQMVTHGFITVDDTEVVHFASHQVRPLSMRVLAGDVMSKEILTVSPSTPVREVVVLVLGKVYRAVPVVDDGRPIGIITNTDLLVRAGLATRLELLASLHEHEQTAALDKLDLHDRTAADVMTLEPVTVSVNAPLTDVADAMLHRHLKRMPVVDAVGALAGMISRLDLLRTVAEGFTRPESEPRELGLSGDLTVAQAMNRDFPAVHPDTPVAELVQAVMSTRLNRAVVVNADRRVVGLVTDEELLRRVTPSARPGVLRSLTHRMPFTHSRPEQEALEHGATGRLTKDLMRAEVPTVREDARLREAIDLMVQGAAKLVAVVDDDGRFVGIVDRADILRALRAKSRSERERSPRPQLDEGPVSSLR